MIQSLSHRGPDAQGFWQGYDGRMHLGHSRLAIIDLSAEGNQPMLSHNGRYVLSFNGEIYNFVELADELGKLGVRFRGHSDTEVILEAFAHWGVEQCLPRFLGMYAIAVWDSKEHRLILARDRVGKKPLYYCKLPETFFFASELNALRSISRDWHLNEEALYHYLTFGFVPAPRTIFKEAMEVPAGHYLSLDADFSQEAQPYWQINWEHKQSLSFSEAVDETERLLKEAVKIRLRADVPVGCFLSGGIDSGLLAALAAQQVERLQTFTISFAEGAFDESPLANLVAEKYGTDHHVIVLSPELEDLFPQVVRAYGEPLADASILPSFLVAREARKYLKVVINGEGGDELFGGYRRQLAMSWFSHFQGLLELMPEAAWRKLSRSLPQPGKFRSKYAFAHRFLRGVVRDPYDRYIHWCVDGFTEAEKNQLYKPGNNGLPSSELLRDRYRTLMHLHPLDHFMAMDFLLNMHDDLLVKMDIATMAHGLEGRNPFLDHRLVEFAASLPPNIRLRGITTKPILRELAKKYLPAEVVTAPKRGFEIPLIEWLRHDLFDMVHATCLASSGLVTTLFDKAYVEDLLFERLDLDPDRWSKRVFTLFMLALWEKVTS